MAAKYGQVHKVADLIKRAIPRAGSGSFAGLLVHRFISLLQALESVQESNPDVTLAIQTGGSIRVIYQGLELLGLQPQAGHIRLGVRLAPLSEQHARLLQVIESSLGAFQERIDSPLDFLGQWRCSAPELQAIDDFLTSLPVPEVSRVDDVRHPRYFPGDVRQWALEAFEQDGRICPGVGRDRHRLDKGERIEFDHILPHARGGPSSFGNIQVLCMDCNRKKSATAY